MPDQNATLLETFVAETTASCPICRAAVTDTVDARCSSCGVRLAVGLSSPDLRLRYWIACVLLFALPAGFGLFMTVYGWMHGHLSGWKNIRILLLMIGLAVISSSLLAWTVRTRRRFWALSHAQQLTRAIISSAATVISLVLLICLLVWID